MTNCGYVRVSSADQNEDRQTLAMSENEYIAAKYFCRQAIWKRF